MTSIEPTNKAVNFESLRRKAVDDYRKERPKYEKFASVIETILRMTLDSQQIKVASDSRTS